MTAEEWTIVAAICVVGFIVLRALRKAVKIEKEHQAWIAANRARWDDEDRQLEVVDDMLSNLRRDGDA